MKIILVYQGQFPFDVRLDKMINSLIEDGHEVFLLCRCHSRQLLFEQLGKCQIRRLKTKFKLFSIPIPINPFWNRFLSKQIQNINPNLIIVRDLPLLPICFYLSKKLNTPFVVDMAELYSEALKVWKKYKAPWHKIWIDIFKIPEFLEKKFIPETNSIFVSCNEYKDYLSSIYKIDTNKITTIFNVPDKEKLQFEKDNKKNHIFTLGYCGQLQKERGVHILILALKNIINLGYPIKLNIVGAGDYEKNLIQLTNNLKISDEITFYGYKNYHDSWEIMNNCDYGIIPHLKSLYTDNTIPNKLFEFLAIGKPVIVSDCEPLKNFVMKNRCGFYYKNDSVEECSEAIIKSIKNDCQFDLESTFEWKDEKTKFLDIINTFK